ncbi:MAG TPA: porin family protein, partial [Rhizomicrobium sp.]
MKIRMIALAGVAAMALSAPAVASDATGWYLGLGVGWDHMGTFEQTFTGGPLPARFKTNTDDSAIIAGTVGYRFANHIRVEDEVSWNRHDVKSPFDGRVSLLTDMLNVVWDIPLTDRWDLSLGAGAGVGRLNADTSIAPFTYLNGKHLGFMYQLIGGFAYSVSDNVDLTLDYRYRSVSVDKNYGTSFVLYDARARDTNEQVAMIGLR